CDQRDRRRQANRAGRNNGGGLLHFRLREMKNVWAPAALALLAVATLGAAQPASSPAFSPQGPAPPHSTAIPPLPFDRCAQCHNPDGAAPFSVLTYESVRQHASQIASLTRARVMPPWRANSDYGAFVGQHPLTQAEIDRIAAWVSAGAPEGDPQAMPA